MGLVLAMVVASTPTTAFVGDERDEVEDQKDVAKEELAALEKQLVACAAFFTDDLDLDPISHVEGNVDWEVVVSADTPCGPVFLAMPLPPTFGSMSAPASASIPSPSEVECAPYWPSWSINPIYRFSYSWSGSLVSPSFQGNALLSSSSLLFSIPGTIAGADTGPHSVTNEATHWSKDTCTQERDAAIRNSKLEFVRWVNQKYAGAFVWSWGCYQLITLSLCGSGPSKLTYAYPGENVAMGDTKPHWSFDARLTVDLFGQPLGVLHATGQSTGV